MSKKINILATQAIFQAYGLAAINEELQARALQPSEDLAAGSLLIAMGVSSLDEFAVTLVNLSHGEVQVDQATSLMAQAYPENKIGNRHGPHYLSLARTGSAAGRYQARYGVPKATRKAGGKKLGLLDFGTVPDGLLREMLKSAEGTALGLAIGRELAGRSTMAAMVGSPQATVPESPTEEPVVEAEPAKVEETHRQRRQRERAEAAAAQGK